MAGQAFTRAGVHGTPPAPGLPWQNMQLPQGQLPPHTAHHLNHHLANLTQQLGLPFPMPGMNNHPGLPHTHNHNQTNPLHQPIYANQTFQQQLAQQQQARAAAGFHGLGNVAGDLHHRADSPSRAQHGDQSLTPGDGQEPRERGNITTTVREGQGPNGAHWRMTINESITPFPGLGSSVNGAIHGREQAMPDSSIASHQGPTTEPVEISDVAQPLQSPRSPSGEQAAANLVERRSQHMRNSLAQMQQRLSSLETALASGYSPSASEFAQARTQLGDLVNQQNILRQGSDPAQIAQSNNLTIRAEQSRARVGLNVGNTNAERSTVASTPTTAPSPMVYLLSSPSGPRALLMTHAEMYTAPFPGGSSFNSISHAAFHHHPHIASQTTAIHRDDAANGQQILAQPAQHGQLVAQRPQQQEQQQPQPNPARDIVHILLPLGGHLWLLVRLFGFVYFFTSGAGWRRTILLGICAILVFVAQTGVLRPLQQAIWEPLRRHVEGLMPGAGDDAPNAGNRAARGDSVAERGDGRGRTEGELDPREVAERLLREQRNGDGDFIRRNLRRVERAVALFLASLVPGVGERHIAARDAVEAVRQAAERAAQERAEREAEEATRQADDSAAETTDEGNNAEANRASAPEEAQGAQQQPLIEV